MANLLSDAEQCMQKLPEILQESLTQGEEPREARCVLNFALRKGLAWPWPAPVLLLGRSLGSAVATHLLGTMAETWIRFARLVHCSWKSLRRTACAVLEIVTIVLACACICLHLSCSSSVGFGLTMLPWSGFGFLLGK